MKTVRIVYSSISGNTEIVCQEIEKVLAEKGYAVSLDKCQLAKREELESCDLLVFACPTYAHGELQVYFGQFINAIQDINIEQKNCAVVGLGDPKYDTDYTVESAKILADFFEKHKAVQVVEPLEIQKCPIPQLESIIKPWAEKLAEKIL